MFLEISRLDIHTENDATSPSGRIKVTDKQILFHGKIVSFEQSSTSRVVTIRLFSLSHLAYSYPAIHTFGFFGHPQSYVIGQGSVASELDDDERAISEQPGSLPMLRFDASDRLFAREHTPLTVLEWLLTGNPYIIWTNPVLPPAGYVYPRIELDISNQGMGEVLETCLNALGSEWFFHVRYDVPPIPRTAPIAVDYRTVIDDLSIPTLFGITGNRYTPWVSIEYDDPDDPEGFILINPQAGVVDWDVNITGEGVVQRTVHMSQQQNPVFVDDADTFGDVDIPVNKAAYLKLVGDRNAGAAAGAAKPELTIEIPNYKIESWNDSEELDTHSEETFSIYGRRVGSVKTAAGGLKNDKGSY